MVRTIAFSAFLLVLLATLPVTAQVPWCAIPFPPCDPNSSNSLCYQPPKPDPRCGEEQCETCRKSPCYVGTGSYEMAATDLSVRTNGFPLRVARRYDSTHAIDGPLGFGWTSGLVARLYHAVYLYSAPSTYQKEAFIQMPEGGRYRFADNGNGTFTPPLGRYDVLAQNGDGTWSLTLQRTRSVYQFDTTGALTSMTDDYGNQLNVTYDGSGRVQQIADASGSGRYLNIVWGPDGRISTVQDLTGRQIQYAYNAQGALSTVTNPLSQVTSYSYATGRFGPLLSQIKDNWNRIVSDITYDTTDRVTSYTDKGETYTYTYSYQGNPAVTAKTDSAGNRFTYTFGAGGLVSDTMPPSGGGGPTHADYYPSGLIQQFTDGVGVKTFYTYNAEGIPVTVTRDYQGSTAVRIDYTYDSMFSGKVIAITPRNPATGQIDPSRQAWRYDYYPPGSPAPGALHHIYRLRDDGITSDTMVTYENDSRGRLTRQTSATGGVFDYGYDAVGNLTTVTAPSNNAAEVRPVTSCTYDASGRATSVIDPRGQATAYTRDALDRVLTVILPKPSPGSALSFQTIYVYDNYDAASGLLFAHKTDPSGILTKQGYNQFGQLASAVDASGHNTAYGYARGLIDSVTDANGNVTSYGYDSGRRLASTTFPDGAVERYTYTADSLLNQITDRKNSAIAYAYDRLKRLSQKTYPASTSIAYTYQGQKLTQAVDSSVTPTETHLYSYDSSLRLASDTQGARGTISYQYNPDDSILSYSVQSGPTAAYTYFPDGSLSRIAWSPVSGEFQYTYTLTGQYQRVTFPNGQYRDYTYDDQGRPLQLANVHPTAGNLAAYAYSYDLNHATGAWDRLGQRVEMTATVPSQGLSNHQTRYEYDSTYQLTKAAYPNVAPLNGEVHSWTYDAVGNRLTNTVNVGTQTCIYQRIGTNPLNWQRLLADGSSSYTYDANGNTATRSGPEGNFTFGWNADDRLVSISGAATAVYVYEYQARRVSGTVGTTKKYLYNGPDLIRETEGSADYLFGPGIDEPLAVSHGGSISYYQVDALGSVDLAADAGGAVQDSYLWDVWGKPRSFTAGVGTPFGYTARESGEASAVFYRTRYYSPEIGRFLSEDRLRLWEEPTATSQKSLYWYADDNPVLLIDPFGLAPNPPDRLRGGRPGPPQHNVRQFPQDKVRPPPTFPNVPDDSQILRFPVPWWMYPVCPMPPIEPTCVVNPQPCREMMYPLASTGGA